MCKWSVFMSQALDKADIYSYTPATEKEGKWFVQVYRR